MEKKQIHLLEKRLGMLLILFLLLASITYIVTLSWRESFKQAEVKEKTQEEEIKTTNYDHSPAPQSKNSIFYATIPPKEKKEEVRSLKEYDARRAFVGAPPYIPHPVQSNFSKNNCLVCHQNGGFVQKWGKYAPISPHGEKFIACQQCHVAQTASPNFQNTNFTALTQQVAKHPALPGSPPIIPHETISRNNCRTCHGVGAVPEFRSTHLERKACTQCHVEQQLP